jgi:DNA repair exonuclease SbcCD ATPase subunit
MSGITDEEVEKKAEQVRQKIAETEKERAALIADNDLAASARAKISAIYNTITQGKAAYVQKTLTAQYKDTCAIQEHEEILFEQRAAWRDRQDELAMTKATVERLEKRRAEIIAAHAAAREEYDSVQGETFDEADTVCRYCGQDLPPDKADEIREAFNARKSERLEKLRGEMNSLLERGKKEASKEMLADAENKVTELENMAAEDEKLFRASSDKLAKAKAEFKLKTPPPFESTDDYKKLKAEIEAIQEAAAKDEPDTTEIDDRLEKLRDHETVLNSVIASNEKSAAQRKRIAELENQEKELGKAYEEAERALYLCDRFSRVKADMLTDKINEKFSTVSFQLFRKNITNDGVEDICDVMIPSPDGSNIPFQYANNSARINAGLEIIGVLGKHYGVSLPVFVDNSESVVRVIPTDCQLIKLAVSENDKLLRLVLND